MPGPPGTLVFLNSRGGPLDSCILRELWVKVLADLGIPYRKPYTTRHSFASHALAQGVPLPDVAYLLGHADSAMVAKVYGHSLGMPALPAIL